MNSDINKSNQISITKVKDSWSREEVETLCRKALYDGTIHGMNEKSDLKYSKWISENL